MARKDPFKDIDFESFITAPPVVEFIGPNYEHYREIWTKDYEKKHNIRKISTAMHLNWLALILSPAVWFFYRKMYVLGGMMVAFYAAGIFFDYYSGKPSGPGVFVGVNIAIALMSKGFYFSHIVQFMEKNRDTAPDILQKRIQNQGGVSVASAVVGSIVGIAGMVAVAMIGETIYGPLPDAP